MLPIAAGIARIAAIWWIADPLSPVHFTATTATRPVHAEPGSHHGKQAALVVAATAAAIAALVAVTLPDAVVGERGHAGMTATGLASKRISDDATRAAANAPTCQQQREARRQSNAPGHHDGSPFHVSKAIAAIRTARSPVSQLSFGSLARFHQWKLRTPPALAH